MTEKNDDDSSRAREPFRRDAETPEQLEAMVGWLEAPNGSPAWVVGPAARRLARDVREGLVPWMTPAHVRRLQASPDAEVRAAFAALELGPPRFGGDPGAR